MKTRTGKLGRRSHQLRASVVVPLLLVGAASSTALADAASDASAPVSNTVGASGAGDDLGEIVVTAERRQTDIQKTPLAISVVSAQTLDKSFVNDVASLNGTVPSLETTKTSGFENIVTIRGVGSETPEEAPTTVPGVSLYIDGVYISNTVSLDQTLFDIDHLEVLRGPQGALYGQSSTGGTINIVTKQPELNQFSGYGDFSVGNYKLTRERLELNLPIGDTLAVRISGQRYDHEGFTNDTAIPGFREDDAHDTSAKAAVLWHPTDDFTATVTGQWYHAGNHGAAQKNINDPDPDPWSIDQDYPSNFELTTALYHLNLQYDLPYFSIRSVTADQYLKNLQQEDSSRSSFDLIGSYDDVAAWNTTLHNWSEELDLVSKPGGPVDWVLGGFFLRQTSEQFVAEFECNPSATVVCTGNPDVAVLPNIETVVPPNLAYGNDSQVLRKSYSLFGQATWHVTSRFRLTGGYRWNEDTYAQNSFNFSAFGKSTVDHSTLNRVPTFRGEGDFDLTPDNMLYASVARGYKPGGVNGFYGQVVVPSIFEPETNTAFEIGAKNFLLDRSLRLNVDGFYYIYKNMQYIEADPVPFDAGITNIPQVHIFGAEGELSYLAMHNHLNINANLSVEDGKVGAGFRTIDSTVTNAIENTSSFTSPCAFGGAYYNPACWAAVIAGARNIGGNVPPAMPKFSGSLNASYIFDIPTGTLTPRAELIYRGSEWARVFNEPALDYIGAYALVNFSVRYALAGTGLQMQLAGTNLANRDGVNSRYTDPFGTGQTSQQYVAPRQVIFTIGYAF
jgi:iron complex outermembrane receptor protein